MKRQRIYIIAAPLFLFLYYSILILSTSGYVNKNITIGSRDPPQHVFHNKNVTKRNPNSTKMSENAENLTLNDIYISVRTTGLHQYSRLPLILKTWFQLAKEQVWFFTDGPPFRTHQYQANGHIVTTNCSSTHGVQALCCKTNTAYNHYIKSGKKWWCRFDDDNYVNIPRLVNFLQQYDTMKDWYLGRPVNNDTRKPWEKFTERNGYYATGGAGYCISKSLAQKMLPIFSDGRFTASCLKLSLTEDLAMAFLLESKLNVKLIPSLLFHSHIEKLKHLKTETFKDQISFSFLKKVTKWTVVKVPGFHGKYDPTRFLSLHCFLFPHFNFCRLAPNVDDL